jgi:uncharacterized phage protein (TIGR01671 family)
MRTILFKAKRLDNGEWVEGYGVIQYKEYNEATIIHKHGNNVTQHTAVDPETVCQYTGLTDKNGNKIWEGDKLFIDYNRFGVRVVEFKNGKYNCAEYDLKRSWVVGNIFDNTKNAIK